MTDLSLLGNLAAYSAQVACIVVVGGGAAALLRINLPSLRYMYWRSVLLLSLALPWLQGRIAPSRPSTSIAGGTVEVLTGSVSTVTSDPHLIAALPSWPRLVLAALVLGIVVRVAWIVSGLVRLRRLRAAGALVPLSGHDALLQQTFAPGVTVRMVQGLRQPVTFGWRRPVVLIPDTLNEHQQPLREAVLCHEFLHVYRGDWISVLGEQLMTSVLWFHPAVWWAVARVQLCREEVVDDLAVRATGARKSYIEALLLFSDRSTVVPAAAFARRRHLFHRIQLVAKEHVMSGTRVALTSLLLAAATVAAVWYSSQIFPLSASPQQLTLTPGPIEKVATPASTFTQIPKVISAPGAEYPPDAAVVNASGGVLVKLTVDQTGGVAEVRPTGFGIGGPGLNYRAVRQDPLPPMDTLFGATDPMRDAGLSFLRAASDAASQWVFEPPAIAPVSFYAVVRIAPDTTRGTNVGPVLLSLTNPPVPAIDPSPMARSGGPGAGAFGVAGGISGGVTPGITGGVEGGVPGTGRQSAQPGRQGGPAGPSPATLAAGTATPTFRQAPPPPPPPPPPPANEPGGRSGGPPVPPPPPSSVDVGTTFIQPIRVGGQIGAPKKIKDVKPVYPAIAQSARVQGIVIIEATIDEHGKVVGAKVLRGIDLLNQAAVDAVMQWEFTPTLLNGVPTPIIMSVTVNFQLAPPPQ